MFLFHPCFLNPELQTLSIQLYWESELMVGRPIRFLCSTVGRNGLALVHHYTIEQNSG